jgi:predicted transcriptional regulator
MDAIHRGTHIPTRIMYEAKLSWKPVQEILNRLVEQEIIEVEDASKAGDKRTKKRYHLTEKGKITLAYFKEADARMVDVL